MIKFHFTFHGGEPALAGYDFYAEALENYQNRQFRSFSLQSNIWLLSDELIDLFFKKYNVAVSTVY